MSPVNPELFDAVVTELEKSWPISVSEFSPGKDELFTLVIGQTMYQHNGWPLDDSAEQSLHTWIWGILSWYPWTDDVSYVTAAIELFDLAQRRLHLVAYMFQLANQYSPSGLQAFSDEELNSLVL